MQEMTSKEFPYQDPNTGKDVTNEVLTVGRDKPSTITDAVSVSHSDEETSVTCKHCTQQKLDHEKQLKQVAALAEVKLKRSHNPWKPNKLRTNKHEANVSSEALKTEYILRQVRSILNKLTPQNFQPLMEKLQTLEINTEVRTDLIFKKAVAEPLYGEAYANLCRTMSQVRIATCSKGDPGTTVEFRKILLTRCQREFEKDKMDQEAIEMLQEKLANTSPQVKEIVKKEIELAKMKERHQTLGNIRFIGELFKLSMLTETIMHNCIIALFRGKYEDSLECLTVLLKTIGKDLDHAKGKQRMSQYIQNIEKIVRENKMSSRVKFLLLDLLDLKKNHWVPRQKSILHPKTIEQICEEYKAKQDQNFSKSIKTILESKYKTIIGEYLNTSHIKKAEQDLNKFKTLTNETLVRVTMQMSLEHSKKSRKNASDLLVNLLTNNTVSPEEYSKGVISVVTEAIDLELDTPKIWQYLAELIAPVLNAESTGISMLYISQLSYPLQEERKTEIFVKEILKQLTLCKNGSDATQTWNKYQNH